MAAATVKGVAAELHKLAASYEIVAASDENATTDKPYIGLYFYESTKQQFLDLVKALPKPLEKIYTDAYLRIKYNSDNLTVVLEIPRKAVCELVHPAIPAKYRCEPLLTEDEEENIIK